MNSQCLYSSPPLPSVDLLFGVPASLSPVSTHLHLPPVSPLSPASKANSSSSIPSSVSTSLVPFPLVLIGVCLFCPFLPKCLLFSFVVHIQPVLIIPSTLLPWPS